MMRNPQLIFIAFLFLTGNLCAQDGDEKSDSTSLFDLTIEELMQIEVITSSGLKQNINEAPSTILVITAQQIHERGYRELTDVFRDISGVDLIHLNGQTPSMVSFRGMFGDENRRVLFMIDGVIENSINGGFEFAGPAYQLDNVERIEIIWGPTSALYGADAYSAVINLITGKGEEINGLEFRKGYGSFKTSTESLLVGLKKENIDFALSGSLYNSEGPIFTNWDSKYSNSYISNAYSVNGKLTFHLSRISTTLCYRNYRTPGGVGEFSASPTNLLNLPNPGFNNSGTGGIIQSKFNDEQPSLFDTYARTGFIESEYTISSKLKLTIRGQYRETGRAPSSYAYVVVPGQDTINRTKYAFSGSRIKGELMGVYRLNNNNGFSAGIQISHDNVEKGLREVIADTTVVIINGLKVTNLNSSFAPRKYILQNNFGSYFQYMLNTELMNMTNYIVGVRYDYNSLYGATTNPRIGVVTQPFEKLTIKLLYGSAFRAPTNFELYTTGINRIANPGLKPEKLKSYEANIVLNPIKSLLFNASVYYNDLSDMILLTTRSVDSLLQNQNIGTASISGFECRVDIIPNTLFSAFANFTYQKSSQSDERITFEVPNISTVKGTIGISWHMKEILRINVIENFVGDRSVVSINPLAKVNGYAITNLSITTDYLFDNKVSIGLTVRNLFNQKYFDPGIRAADGKFYPSQVDQPGINGMLKVAVKL